MKVTQSYPALWDTTDCIVHGILQARILDWVAIPFFWGSSQPRDQSRFTHPRQILYQLSHKGIPRILEWVAYPFSNSNPGIGPGSSALQVDSLPAEVQWSQKYLTKWYIPGSWMIKINTEYYYLKDWDVHRFSDHPNYTEHMSVIL